MNSIFFLYLLKYKISWFPSFFFSPNSPPRRANVKKYLASKSANTVIGLYTRGRGNSRYDFWTSVKFLQTYSRAKWENHVIFHSSPSCTRISFRESHRVFAARFVCAHASLCILFFFFFTLDNFSLFDILFFSACQQTFE